METEELKERTIKVAWQLAVIFTGSSITAAGISIFLKQHKLLSGGVSGTSLLISYFTHTDPGWWIIAINIPLFVIAWRKIDLNFCIYSIIGTLWMSIGIVILNNLPIGQIVSDPLVAALFGGMLAGGGTGIVLRARGSQGGTDIISVIARRRFSVSLGMVSFYINLVLVAILSFKYGIEPGLLTVFSQYVGALVLDRVVTGFDTAKSVTIVSDKPDEIANYIMKRMYRGVTFLEGEGGYESMRKRVIWCIVTRSQLALIKGAMKKIDPEAFMVITDASEIVGKGFYKSPY